MKIKKAKIYLSTIDKLNGYIVFKNLQINLNMVSHKLQTWWEKKAKHNERVYRKMNTTPLYVYFRRLVEGESKNRSTLGVDLLVL